MRSIVGPTTPRVRATPPPGLTRITRLGQRLLDAPVQIVAVSRTAAGVIAACPEDAPTVPLRVAQQLSTAEDAVTVEAADGSVWSGAAVRGWGRGIHISLCTTSTSHEGQIRTTLADLAALATDVLRLDTALGDVDGLRELLGTVSHDLRNPLSVLRAGLETLTLHGEDLPDGQSERIADLAVRQARRMSAMIDGLLSLNGLEDEGANHEPLDLRQLVRDAVEAGRLSHELADLELDGELPADPVTVRGVPDSLARMLTNLVSNAAVHGGGHVWVGLTVHGGDATITVADDGPGMPHDSALDTGRRASRDGGHGLGLVIARRIATAHDGSIGHRARADGGTVVQLTLPLDR
ncbi:MAG: HAMP domain-containing sensor histidine kinase [Xanthomonadales bacterium]|nr:HAMP domain-containing sensor histidine kinase [Xanthomonadales bacterium]